MNSFAAKYGVWGLVTGASSGMGTEFARRLAESGLNIVLLARREDRLRSLADELERDYSVKTRVVAVDLTRDDLLDLIREATVDIEIGLLVNNAGFATSGNLLDNDLDAELAMLHVNSRAPLILSHHFGRRMRERGGGGIIFVASTVAYSGSPGWSNYAATKAFELTLSDGIARELKRHGVSVLTVSPGPTQTEFWQVAGGKPLLALTPERVVRTALNNLGRRSTVVVGWINKLIVLSTRFTPRWMNSVIFGRVVKFMQAGKSSRAKDSQVETSSSAKAA
jgi:short-subunit dehydrogenase